MVLPSIICWSDRGVEHWLPRSCLVLVVGSDSLIQRVLYITGRGGNHTRGLGGHISTFVSDYRGVSLDVSFLSQGLDEQIKALRAGGSSFSRLG